MFQMMHGLSKGRNICPFHLRNQTAFKKSHKYWKKIVKKYKVLIYGCLFHALKVAVNGRSKEKRGWGCFSSETAFSLEYLSSCNKIDREGLVDTSLFLWIDERQELGLHFKTNVKLLFLSTTCICPFRSNSGALMSKVDAIICWNVSVHLGS